MTLRYRDHAPALPHVMVGVENISIPDNLPSPVSLFLLRTGDSSAEVTAAWEAVLRRLPEQGDQVFKRFEEVPVRDTEIFYTVGFPKTNTEATLQFFV